MRLSLEWGGGNILCNFPLYILRAFLQASRVDKVEGEVLKYKLKLNELDFYKQRVEVCYN